MNIPNILRKTMKLLNHADTLINFSVELKHDNEQFNLKEN